MSDAKETDDQQPESTPRSQHGESKPIGPGPSGETQTDDQDNLHNNVSTVGDGEERETKRQ